MDVLRNVKDVVLTSRDGHVEAYAVTGFSAAPDPLPALTFYTMRGDQIRIRGPDAVDVVAPNGAVHAMGAAAQASVNGKRLLLQDVAASSASVQTTSVFQGRLLLTAAMSPTGSPSPPPQYPVPASCAASAGYAATVLADLPWGYW